MALTLGDTDSIIIYANQKIYSYPTYILINKKDP